ncbi:MAG: rhomboid family intramembrane serine protease [Candidatus Riflebacteria bacterium]|nr:rhomboid family intramembrane serine protease [Candidatus Riflebacteria bacterium]
MGTEVCKRCGTTLPLGVTGTLCDRCLLGVQPDATDDLADWGSGGSPAPGTAGSAAVFAKAPGPGDGSKVEAAGLSGLLSWLVGGDGTAGGGQGARSRRRTFFPVGTLALLVANCIVFVGLTMRGGGEDALVLLSWGAKSNELIYQGQLWRFITPIFIHIGAWHLAGNCVVLYPFGRALERVIGTGCLVQIYIISGICGVIAGFCFHDQLSAGASGAIFGLFGALLAFLTTNRSASSGGVQTRDVVFFCLWILAFLLAGSQVKNIDNWAHVGGLVGGLLSGLVLVPRVPHVVPRPGVRWAAGCLLLVLAAAGTYRGAAWIRWIRQGEQACRRGDLVAARLAFRQAASLRPRPVTALWALARIEMRDGKDKEAERILTGLVQMDPDSAVPHYHLSDLYRETGRSADSLRELEAAHTLDPDRDDVKLLLGRGYLEAGDHRKALAILERCGARASEADPLVEYYRGDALRRLGQIERGLKHFQVYENLLRARLDKNPGVGHNNLAWFLFEEGRDLKEALPLAKRAVEINPFSPYFQGTLGCVYYGLSRYRESLNHLDKALEYHQSRADSATDLYFAAMATARLGARDRARELLRQADEVDPRNRYRTMAHKVVQ